MSEGRPVKSQWLKAVGMQTYDTRFLVVILGALTPAPKILAPVTKIPQPAPITLRPMQRPIPVIAHAYGEVCSKNAPMLNDSPLPTKAQRTRGPIKHGQRGLVQNEDQAKATLQVDAATYL